ncbi:DEAD/DEAH box helicase [Algicella marina]|uniref:DEAD-box ATP-dependent RNA helicase RhpA n=1 Tax=Algicella marina TaxID=2683284 RepID=A0A6P1SXQ2_9RHOB|nr:DEAD/DEAH box helicase [Algicella marina]QHQ34123.1 DEAD/DEAH box helicase [Algicella marina]
MTNFSDFNFKAPIAKALEAEGYSTPTPIQAQSIPLVLEGHDLLGIAQTGTGKTAAFALPILDRLCRGETPRPKRGTRCLVLAPTRELASQIAASFEAYGKFLHLSVFTVFGGVSVNRQINRMQRGTDILVATPGRLLDLINQRALKLSDVEVLVLDEADQMLDMGFIHDLRKIVPLVPKERQTLFFSATMPSTIAELADQFLTEPKKVSVAPAATTAERVDQHAYFLKGGAKRRLLAHQLRDPEVDRVLVFTRTKHGADKVVKHLEQDKINAAAIHGNKSQGQRERALKAFRDGRTKVLVATDIAARGIDVPGVSHVINFDVPNVPEQYVHRIGRTARAGREGIAISYIAGDEQAYLRDIERTTGMPLDRQALPTGFEEEAETEVAHAPKPKGNSRRRGRGNPQNHGGGNKGRGKPNGRSGAHAAKGSEAKPVRSGPKANAPKRPRTRAKAPSAA